MVKRFYQVLVTYVRNISENMHVCEFNMYLLCYCDMNDGCMVTEHVLVLDVGSSTYKVS